MKNRTTKKIAFNDLTSIPVEENFIKKRKKQRTDETEEHRKTLHSCFQKIMKTRHDLFLNTPNEVCFSIRSLIGNSLNFFFAHRFLIPILRREFMTNSEIRARNP